jgi:hypothetical protein
MFQSGFSFHISGGQEALAHELYSGGKKRQSAIYNGEAHRAYAMSLGRMTCVLHGPVAMFLAKGRMEKFRVIKCNGRRLECLKIFFWPMQSLEILCSISVIC